MHREFSKWAKQSSKAAMFLSFEVLFGGFRWFSLFLALRGLLLGEPQRVLTLKTYLT